MESVQDIMNIIYSATSQSLRLDTGTGSPNNKYSAQEVFNLIYDSASKTIRMA